MGWKTLLCPSRSLGNQGFHIFDQKIHFFADEKELVTRESRFFRFFRKQPKLYLFANMEESVTGEMEMFNLLKTMEIFANTIFYLQTNESLSLGNWKYQLKKKRCTNFRAHVFISKQGRVDHWGTFLLSHRCHDKHTKSNINLILQSQN